MEEFEEDWFPEASGSQRLFPDPPGASGWAHLHRAVIVLVMGFLMCAVGGLLFLLLALGVTEGPPRPVASACLSLGLLLGLMGLLWIPVLKEKQRRKGYCQAA
ncbi:hypothetical protein CgunFtcFv8_001584 [Champsocephalus gunnari]|uniref:Uncharacterized protein n=1 Tax=Champsocephalus gunnari TaxID=52237 RepID=A0AAN8CL86_CHAGU|nr:hypothetical protein CgunFtcFv8_001584 [Champsocephalus gunnari]